MLQLCAYLLEDKRRVTVAYQCSQQLLRVAEQESVTVFIQFAHLLFDATQEA